MSSATLFLKNKYLLVLSVLVILVAGLSALVSMPRLEDPRIVNRNPLIVTLVPGASAERVEALVTEKLEEQLQEVPEIQEMRSTSRAGVSIIAVELADRVYESQKVFSLIRDKIAEAEPALPREAATPFLDDQRGPVAYSLILGVTWEHTSEPKLGILNRLAEELADQLRTIAGTQVVRLFGAPREEITVTVDPKELAALGMTPSELATSIRAADSKVPAGMLRSGRDDLILEVAGELDSLAQIGSIPLREGNRRDPTASERHRSCRARLAEPAPRDRARGRAPRRVRGSESPGAPARRRMGRGSARDRGRLRRRSGRRSGGRGRIRSNALHQRASPRAGYESSRGSAGGDRRHLLRHGMALLRRRRFRASPDRGDRALRNGPHRRRAPSDLDLRNGRGARPSHR